MPVLAALALSLTDFDIYALADGDNLVGRAPHCQAVIADTTVSREHARIRCDSAGGEATIEHLSKVNRTLVGGDEVSGPRRLTSGDTLELGLARLEFQHAGDVTQSVRPPAAGHSQGSS